MCDFFFGGYSISERTIHTASRFFQGNYGRQRISHTAAISHDGPETCDRDELDDHLRFDANREEQLNAAIIQLNFASNQSLRPQHRCHELRSRAFERHRSLVEMFA